MAMASAFKEEKLALHLMETVGFVSALLPKETMARLITGVELCVKRKISQGELAKASSIMLPMSD
jgi:hypothetical protein